MPQRVVPLPAGAAGSGTRHRRRIPAPSGPVIAGVFLTLLGACALGLVGLAVTTAEGAPSSPSGAAGPVITAGAVPTPVVAVVAGGSSPVFGDGWSGRLGDLLDADVATVDAVSAADLSTALQGVPTDADVVVIVTDGLAPAGSLRSTASAALEDVRLRAPYADLVLLGPAETGSDAADREGLAAIAARNDARWVNPVGLGWVVSTDVRRVSAVLSPLLPATP